MEKSVAAAADEKFNNHVHQDIAFAVLSKLPSKSLTRFGCVCKSWFFLLENPYFMAMFRKNFLCENNSYYNDTSIFLRYDPSWNDINPKSGGMFSLSGERFEHMVKLDWPNLFHEDQTHFKICGSTSVNGILCIDYNSKGRVVLWNPTTKEFKLIPSSPLASRPSLTQFYFHGFGYDHIRDDYKMIRHVRIFSPTIYDVRYETLWEIYCLKSNSWRKLDVDLPTCSGDQLGVQVYMDGVCHWWSKSKTHGCRYETYNEVIYLVSFDLTTEMFVTTSIPSNMDDIGYKYLGVLNGFIALVFNYAKETTFHISILGEVGMKESWTKLFSVELLHDIDWPIGVSNNGDIFFIKKDDKLVCFNLSTQRVQELGVKGTYYSRIITYKESHVPIERKNQ